MEDDDEYTEPDKQSKKIKQSSKKQSKFTLIKKPAKKMKRKQNLKRIKRSKQDDSSFSKRLKKTKTATAQKTSPPSQHSLNTRKTIVKQVSKSFSTTSPSSR
jgi:hypothetical protein